MVKDIEQPMESKVDLHAMDCYKEALEEWTMDDHLFYINDWRDQLEDEFEGERWDDIDTMYKDTFESLLPGYNKAIIKMWNTSKESSEYTSLDHKVTDTGIQFVITQCADFVEEMELEVPYEDNINAWMDQTICYEIGNQRIFQGTLRCVAALLNDIGGHKIVPDIEKGTVRIPLQIANFLSRKRLDIICLSFHEVRLYIKLAKNHRDLQLNKLKMWVMCGFMPYKPRIDLLHTKLSMLITQSGIIEEYVVQDQHDTFMVPINGLTIFIIVWYVIDTSFFAENQSLQPEILTAEWEIGNEFVHMYRLSEIKKLKCGNYTGFVFPVNRFLYDKYIEFVQKMDHKTDLEFLNRFITYSRIDVSPKLKILWSNCQPGSTIIIEQLLLNEYQMMNGMGRLKWMP